MTLKGYIDKLCKEYNVQYRVKNYRCYIYGRNRFIVANLLASLIFQYGMTSGIEADLVLTMEGEPDEG